MEQVEVVGSFGSWRKIRHHLNDETFLDDNRITGLKNINKEILILSLNKK